MHMKRHDKDLIRYIKGADLNYCDSQMGVEKMGVDKMGVEKMGVEKMGVELISSQPSK